MQLASGRAGDIKKHSPFKFSSTTKGRNSSRPVRILLLIAVVVTSSARSIHNHALNRRLVNAVVLLNPTEVEAILSDGADPNVEVDPHALSLQHRDALSLGAVIQQVKDFFAEQHNRQENKMPLDCIPYSPG